MRRRGGKERYRQTGGYARENHENCCADNLMTAQKCQHSFRHLSKHFTFMQLLCKHPAARLTATAPQRTPELHKNTGCCSGTPPLGHCMGSAPACCSRRRASG